MNAGRTLLVAEDEDAIREALVDTLESEGYRVVAAADGEEALERFAAQPVDLVLLDLMMPRRNGYEVCREIRRRNEDVAIIMLTAKGEEVDKVLGLELGADDYVTKPFGLRELLARVHAALRRSTPPAAGAGEPPASPFPFGEAEIDPRRYEARLGGESRALTGRELSLIALFRERPGEVLDRAYLLDRAWGVDYFGTTRTLDQHIAQLRKKIESDPGSPRTILTVHGVGYRYRPA